eukprot:SAG22_NODE_2069_length_3054_cov_1.465313_2_plen_50_part_00
MLAAVTFNGLKNLAENDFTMFVRGFQIHPLTTNGVLSLSLSLSLSPSRV